MQQRSSKIKNRGQILNLRFALDKNYGIMQFFKLNLSTDPKIIGRRFPQIHDIISPEEYDRESENSIYRISSWEEITSDLNVPDFILHGHSKRTDIVSGVSYMLLISNRLKELVESHSLPRSQVFETSIIARGKKYSYSLFYLPDNSYQFIDFARSTFALVPFGRPVATHFPEINSLEEFESWVKKYPYLVKSNPHRLKVIVDKLVFDIDKIPYDMFRIIGPFSPQSYFVSERLKNAIEDKGFTGMDFIPLEELMNVLPQA